MADSMSVGSGGGFRLTKLRVPRLHRTHQADERVEHMDTGSGHPAARRRRIRVAPHAAEPPRVLVAGVAFDVHRFAEFTRSDDAAASLACWAITEPGGGLTPRRPLA